MTIAVTGATGFVGQALLERAEQEGLAVKALTRRKQVARDGIEWVQGDLEAKAALRQLVRGSEAVIHVAGVVNAPDAAGFEAGNVTGTLNVIEACLAEGVQRFIHVSSLSAREPDLSVYGASKARAEKLVAASGLALWAARNSDWLPQVLALHLGSVMALFVTLPYGKMVHGFFRWLALVRHSVEQRQPNALGLGGE